MKIGVPSQNRGSPGGPGGPGGGHFYSNIYGSIGFSGTRSAIIWLRIELFTPESASVRLWIAIYKPEYRLFLKDFKDISINIAIIWLRTRLKVHLCAYISMKSASVTQILGHII